MTQLKHLPPILILYTGGTLGMDLVESRKSNAILLEIPKLSAELLKKRFKDQVPELNQIARCEVEILLNRDSAHIGPEEWVLMARKIKENWKNYEGVVLLHGTDTLAYTASALSFLLTPCLKPVVMTGAQRPLSALRTDARTNLISAVEIAAHGPKNIVQQVTVFFGDQLFQGNRVRKRSATDFSAFESPTRPALATVGTTVRYAELNSKKKAKTDPTRPAHWKSKLLFSKNVALLHVTPGFPAAVIAETLVPRLEGIVLVIYPTGTAPTLDGTFIQFLVKAKQQKIPVVLTTESNILPPSQVSIQLNYSSSQELLAHGALSAGSMTPECAFVKTCLLLGQTQDLKRFKELWNRELAGEGTV